MCLCRLCNVNAFRIFGDALGASGSRGSTLFTLLSALLANRLNSFSLTLDFLLRQAEHAAVTHACLRLPVPLIAIESAGITLYVLFGAKRTSCLFFLSVLPCSIVLYWLNDKSLWEFGDYCIWTVYIYLLTECRLKQEIKP
jgi:hypothetical protein